MTTTTLNTSNPSEANQDKAISVRQNLQGNSHEGGEDRKDVYSIVTDRILSYLEQGIVPWRQAWRSAGQQWPKNLVSDRRYNGINAFMLAMTGFSSSYFLTFKQAKEMGGSIKKGEKGFPVIHCKKVTGKKQQTEDGEGMGYFFLRYYTVFNIEQTEGVPLPAAAAPAEKYEFTPIEACERVSTGYRGAPDITHNGAFPFYSPTTDRIGMPPKDTFDCVEEYYSTLFHEMTHSTGHKTRLGRDGITEGHSFGDADYSKEELVAEMGAAFLCAHAQIAPSILNNSAAYIGS